MVPGAQQISPLDRLITGNYHRPGLFPVEYKQLLFSSAVDRLGKSMKMVLEKKNEFSSHDS